ncbi:MAG TPA: hypothetical protein VES01_05070 [Dermatophilaceae bacterium]|nr:hypothetical protein [Dermatophilaceae bacterium]
MSPAILGLFAGLLLGVAAAAGGFTGFLVAIVLGAVGLGVGQYLGGDLDLGALTGSRNRRNG